MMVSINVLPLLVVVAALGVVLVNGELKNIPLWADLYLRSHTDWEDIDFKLAFLMDNYNVVSLEKCLYQGSNGQDTVSIVDELPSSVCFLRKVCFPERKISWRQMLATIFALSLAGPALGEQVGKIPMWTDLGLGRLTDWEDLDFKLAFLMDTYQVVSLEKCLFRGSNDQNTVSASGESKMCGWVT